MKKVLIKIEGMTCAGCSSGLERYLNSQDGIIKAEVSLVLANASIEYDENIIDFQKINDFVKGAGFKSLGIDTYEVEDKILKKEKSSLIITIVLGIIVMFLSMGHMLNLPNISYLDTNKSPKIYGIVVAVLTTAIIFVSFKTLKNGIKKIIKKVSNMDSLISIGVITSYFYSIYSLIMIFIKDSAYVYRLYFESAAMVLLFTKIGKYIDSKNKIKTRQAVTNLTTITPSKAVILKDGKEIKIDIDMIEKGDVVICKPGEKIAVDGKVIGGRAHIDDSFITGESLPKSVTKGDTVLAGSINVDGYIEYVAEKIGRESAVSEIVKTVVNSINTKPPIAKYADKICYYFVPAIVIIALVASLVWIIIGQTPTFVLNIFISVLVVACPCALGLATPMATVQATYLGVKKGIIIKNSRILEDINKIDTVVFDKTGTLTEGKLSIIKINRYSDMTENGILQLMGSVEKSSEHPIAKAILDRCDELGIKLTSIRNVDVLPGLGLKALHKKHEVIIGSQKLMIENEITIQSEDDDVMYSDTNIVIYLGIDKKLIASIGFKDDIKKSAKEVVSGLQADGIEVVMLTGDNKNTARSIADELNIENVIASVMPSEKAKKIMDMKKDKKVMMVGDGINDAPSLVNADVGVSFENATDIAKDSSDVVILKGDLTKIETLLKLSKKSLKIIKQNLFWAFIYNIIMIPIACGVLNELHILLNPMYSSIAMTASSIFVVLNSLRLGIIK